MGGELDGKQGSPQGQTGALDAQGQALAQQQSEPHVFCQALLSRSRHGFVSHFPSPDDGRPTGSVTTK